MALRDSPETLMRGEIVDRSEQKGRVVTSGPQHQVARSAQNSAYLLAGVMLMVKVSLSAVWLKDTSTDTTLAALSGKNSVVLGHGDAIPVLVSGLANGHIIPLAVALPVFAVLLWGVAFFRRLGMSSVATRLATVFDVFPGRHEWRSAYSAVNGSSVPVSDYFRLYTARIRTITLTNAWAKLNPAPQTGNDKRLMGFRSHFAPTPNRVLDLASVRAEDYVAAVIVGLEAHLTFWARLFRAHRFSRLQVSRTARRIASASFTCQRSAKSSRVFRSSLERSRCNCNSLGCICSHSRPNRYPLSIGEKENLHETFRGLLPQAGVRMTQTEGGAQ